MKELHFNVHKELFSSDSLLFDNFHSLAHTLQILRGRAIGQIKQQISQGSHAEMELLITSLPLELATRY